MGFTNIQRKNAAKSRKRNTELGLAEEYLKREFNRMNIFREPTKKEIEDEWNRHQDQNEEE